ncbi:MAG: PEP-CTERM sorting domain-containing protein [Phycisphaerales bacterium]|nr:PEP-CTERM sorting domain-containing protein [Phycisphaerales bacterium]
MSLRYLLVAAVICATPAFAGSLFFDFGDPGQNTGSNYNNMNHNGTYPNPPAPIANAIDSTGAATGISLAVNDIFWPGTNFNGTQAPIGDAAQFDVQATRDNFFGSTVAFGGFTEPTGGFTLAGLNPGNTYTFTFFASRTGVSDVREAYYAVSGQSSETVLLNASNNVSEVAVTMALQPLPDGTMTIQVGPGPNNTNASGFYYIGSMRIDEVPEPASALLIALGAVAAFARRR